MQCHSSKDRGRKCMKSGDWFPCSLPCPFFPKPVHCSCWNRRFTGVMSTFYSIFSRFISLYSHCLPYCSRQGLYLKDTYQLQVIVFLNSLLTLVSWKTKPIQQFTTTALWLCHLPVSFWNYLFNSLLNMIKVLQVVFWVSYLKSKKAYGRGHDGKHRANSLPLGSS